MNYEQAIEKITNVEILANQTLLIEKLFATDDVGIIFWEQVENCYYYNYGDCDLTQSEYDKLEESLQDCYTQCCHEVLQWWLVTEWLAGRLIALGYPVLKNEYGNWWGRGTYGQLLSDDIAIDQIAKELI